ncbi:MAG: NEW3 domain-containing protein, partial [Gemmatimonadota bacterium]|nr:NEW3 domain-containing protein [Gemmatimonadota bacterium]
MSTRTPIYAAAADSAKDASITLPAIIASGAPRSYQVVSLEVPASVGQASYFQLEILPRGEFVVLGSMNRYFPSEARTTRIPITIGIPASALAGRLLAAEARFSVNGAPTLIVPVEINVGLVRRLALRPLPAPSGPAGSDVMLRFDVENLGNARETVDVQLTLPAGWASRELRHRAVVIEPGTTVQRRARISIPRLSSTGSSFVTLDLKTGSELLASSTVTLEVFNSGSIASHAGPQLVSSISQATDENRHRSRVYSLSASGALFDSVRIDARMSQSSSLGAAASSAFARMGTQYSAPSVVLSSPSGQLSMGNTGTSFSELTGLYPYGEGALLHIRKPGWDLITLGARSIDQAGLGRREPMLGVRLERQLGDLRLSSSISHLADGGASPRSLDAVGVGAAVPAPFGSTFKAEVAERRFSGGRGIGWSSELVRTQVGSSEQFRLTSAPGGSDAFARGTREMVANVSERLTARSMISASAWRTVDETSVFSGLTSSGFSLRPQYDIRSGTTIALEGRSYLFDATSRAAATNTGSSFGSRESQVGLSVSTRVRQYYANTSAFLGNVSRSSAPLGQVVIRDRAPRNYWTTTAGWAGIGGMLEAQARIEQTRDRGGVVNQQNVFGIRGEQIVAGWLGGIRAEADLQRSHGFGTETSALVRGGLSIPLINGFAIKLEAERNSIFRSIAGGTPWVFGTRIEHALTLPMLRTPGTTGYVYQDVNGNHRRDRGEAGVAGAIVRRGAETSGADESGKYRLGGDARQLVAVDEASLPEGWAGSGASHGDLPVT